jgi:uncharacterized RDD family membrane protein YckC
MKPRFEPDDSAGIQAECSASESYDATERRFAISLESAAPKSARFIVETPDSNTEIERTSQNKCEEISSPDVNDSSCQLSQTHSSQPELMELRAPQTNQSARDESNGWRQEVSSRLSKYQSRRRLREPRYPSLQLKFESPEPRHVQPENGGLLANTSIVAENIEKVGRREELPQKRRASAPDIANRILEFPRSPIAAPFFSEELAEPVFERPRIMEAPELVADAPALGGILIEPMEAPASEKRPGFEMPLKAARLAKRLAASVVDAAIIFLGLAIFGSIFWQMTGLIPPIRLAMGLAVAVIALLWGGYQYLLMVHCGTTPGLLLAKLQLSNFDGTAVPRKMRRWRIFASILSALSLGLGYAWCFLDEDQLCWHDRITRTYIAPVAPPSSPLC